MASYADADGEALSGQYDSLLVSVVDGQVTGALHEDRIGNGTDDAPQFSCIFMLKGKLIGDHADIVTWAPGDKEIIHGSLVFKEGSALLKLDQNQAGCSMTSGDMVDQPYEVTKTSEGSGWLGVAMVSAEKVIFRSGPGAKPGRTPFVLRFDPVVVVARSGNWVKASYLGGDKPVTGWLDRSELDFNPPPDRQ
ncbi:hypothetical protein [Mesorhizobium loti]|uniref:hypothetical protein n=1 Tax=Rhizobium loti TaxID=381 RepID=UPI00126871ED|nr:hypothetical protein [Mesorhizobium loti]